MKTDEMITPGCYIARPQWLSYIPSSALSENAKTVWCQLASHLRDKATCWPTYDSLCFTTGLSRKVVDDALDRLRQLRLVKSWRERRHNVYELFAPRALLEAEQAIDNMRAERADGQPNDWGAYEQRAKQGLLAWREELLAADGPDVMTLGLKGEAARRGSHIGTAKQATMNGSDMGTVTSSDMGTASGSDIGTANGSEAGTQNTPYKHSTQPLKVNTPTTPPVAPGAGEGPAGLKGQSQWGSGEGHTGGSNSSASWAASAARSAHSPTLRAPGTVHMAASAAQAEDGEEVDEHGFHSHGSTPPAATAVAAHAEAVEPQHLSLATPKRQGRVRPGRRSGGRSFNAKGTDEADDDKPVGDAQVTVKATASLEAMTTYLLNNADAIGAEDPSKFPVSKLNWRQHCTIDPVTGNPTAANIERWTANSFMGFYWYRVCRYHSEQGNPLKLPAWSRLAGEVRNILKQRPPQQVYDFIVTLTQRFGLLLWMAGPTGNTLKLDEMSLSQPRIVALTDNIRSMSKERLAAAYAAAKAGTSFIHFENPPREYRRY